MPTIVGFVESGCPFPIGYGGFFLTDPSTIYSGTTWEQKKDVFILASGDTYKAGSTGGEAKHVLTVDEIAKHRHWISGAAYDDGNMSSSGVSNTQDYGLAADAGSYSQSDVGKQYGRYDQYTGGSQPHNNMPPYFAMPFWIRTA